MNVRDSSPAEQDSVIHNDTDLLDVDRAQCVVDAEVTSVARQALDDAEEVKIAKTKAQLVAARGGAATLAAASKIMERARAKSAKARGRPRKAQGNGRAGASRKTPLIGPLASALARPDNGPDAEPIDLRPYLPSAQDRPEWYEPVPLLGGHTVADVLTLCADRTTAGQDSICAALGITARQWSAWLLCAPRELADLTRRLQRIGLADAGIDGLRDLLADPDPYIRLGAVKMAVLDLDPERHAGSLHKDEDGAAAQSGPAQIIIQISPDLRTI